MSSNELRESLVDRAPDLDSVLAVERGQLVMRIPPEELLGRAATLLDLGFDYLEMITAIDRGDQLELLYVFESRRRSASLVVRANVSGPDPSIASLTGLWTAADWQEREVFDLFGVEFDGHPHLSRILLPEDWVGHPLRKDYRDERIIPRPDYI
jgi:NADH-quinone oxidoreductase subunit C